MQVHGGAVRDIIIGEISPHDIDVDYDCERSVFKLLCEEYFGNLCHLSNKTSYFIIAPTKD